MYERYHNRHQQRAPHHVCQIFRMGKKSKRRTGKKDGNGASSSSSRATPATGRLTPASLATSVVPHLSDSSFANPFEGEPTPGTGWARELRHAEHELKDDGYRDDGIVLRAAKAACAMRQFDRLGKIIGKAELKGVTIDGAENYALMRSFRDAVEKHNGRSTGVNDPQIKALLKKAEKEDLSLDTSTIAHGTYADLTPLQYAAYQGDVPLLERLVALGVALDYTFDPEDSDGTRDRSLVKKPVGCTALLMAVVGAICSRQLLAVEGENKWRKMYEGGIECAVALVRMGANVDVKLLVPTGRDANSMTYQMMRMMDMVGKSVKQLAPETGSDLLVRSIQMLDSEEAKIEFVNCRCGSRLPWKKCHSGAAESGRHYQLDRRLNWRYSPLAPCPCKNTAKTYFKCCWGEAFREYSG